MWFFAGTIAFIVAIVNLILGLLGKRKYCSVLIFVSLSGALLAMLGQYAMVKEWVLAEDVAALADVVPTMHNVLVAAVGVGVAINAISLYLNFTKQKR